MEKNGIVFIVLYLISFFATQTNSRPHSIGEGGRLDATFHNGQKRNCRFDWVCGHAKEKEMEVVRTVPNRTRGMNPLKTTIEEVDVVSRALNMEDHSIHSILVEISKLYIFLFSLVMV